MKKYEMLDKVIRLLNTCEIHSSMKDTFLETFKFYQIGDRKFLGEVLISQYFDSGDGRLEAFGQVRNLNCFELLLLRGIISANHSRILYF